MNKATLKLQHIPPSTNSLFANVARKGRVKTDRYRTWLQAAGWDMKRYHNVKFTDPVYVTILIGKLPATADIDNRSKAILDLLVTHGTIPGDTVKWVRGVNIALAEEPFEGVQIAISPALYKLECEVVV